MADVFAESETVECLVLHRDSYQKTLFSIEEKKVLQNIEVVQGCPVTSEWNLNKIEAYIKGGNRYTYDPNELVFKIGDPCSFVYYILEGSVDLELLFEIRNIQMIPFERNRYESKTTRTAVRRVVRTFTEGELFGYTDLVHLHKLRIFSARVVSQTPLKVFYITRENFLLFHSIKEICHYQELCTFQTNYVELGRTQLQDIKNHTRQMRDFVNSIDYVH